jgi:hypothetical protein
MSNLATKAPLPVTQSGSVRLKNRVARLADRRGRARQGSRALDGASSEALLSALLLEIDEIILPREIRAETDDGKGVDVLVSNRRLVGLSNADPAECTDPRFVLDRLRVVFAQASAAAIETGRVEKALSRVHNGVSAESLLSILLVEVEEQPEPNPIPTFFAALQSEMLAWVTLSHAGRLHKHGGDARWGDRLVDLTRSQLANLESQRRQSQTSPTQSSCVLLNFGDGDGFILLYARSTTSGFLAMLPMACLTEIQSAWKARNG